MPQSAIEPITFTPPEVESVLKSLKTGMAAGPDAINNRLLIELAQPLASPLCDLYNLQFTIKTPTTLELEYNVFIYKIYSQTTHFT